ncbi:MAG: hypothetical protein ABI429_10625, partial [Jatrophihabitantaceae bacterium]
GAKGCTVTALTSTNKQGVFIGVGSQDTSSVTEAVTTDTATPWEVTLSQGTAVGVKVGVGASVGDPPIDGSAIGTALLGYAQSSTYDVATQTEADRIVMFGSDPRGHQDPATLALLASSQQWAYTGVDASIGGAAGAFGAISGSVGLGVEIGDAHSRDGYTQHLTSVTGDLAAEADLGLAAGTGLHVALVQDVLIDPNGRVVGVTDKATTDDDSSIGVATPDIALNKAGTGGPVGEAAHTFALKAGGSGDGVVDETDGTVSFDDPAVRARGIADLAKESAAFNDPVQALSGALDLVRLIGSDGFVSVRRSVVDQSTTGVAVDVGLDVVISVDFTGSKVSTALLDAQVVGADGSLAPWGPCQQAATITLPTASGALPGIGATMADWLVTHIPDQVTRTYVVDDVCAPSAPPSCSGGFPIDFDPGGPRGDLFQLVDAVQGNNCPIPFVASARAQEEQNCRVGEMVILLPHAVSTAAADTLARSQLPPDVTVRSVPPLPAQVNGELSCQTWTSPTLAALTSLSDPSGNLVVGYFSHSVDLVSIWEMFNFGPPGPPYNPNDIVAIAISTGGGRLALC